MEFLAVGIGGVIGALLRYYAGLSIHPGWNFAFPLGTLIVNLAGSMILGWFIYRVARSSGFPSWIRLGFGTGLIGSFTTFSTFSIETLELLQSGRWGTALLYVLISMLGGLLMTWSGIKFASIQLRRKERGLELP